MNRGSCLCGAVQFEAGPAGFMVHCHCSMCRKHHGAVFATFLAVPREGFRWLAGADEIVTYCGVGSAACVDALALTVLGHDRVQVYDGSLADWWRHEQLAS